MMKCALGAVCLLLLLNSLQANNWGESPGGEPPADGEAPPDTETPPEEYPAEEPPSDGWEDPPAAEETPPEESALEAEEENVSQGLIPFPHTPFTQSTRCGEVLRCPSGGIFYKPFEATLPNERCAWIISVEEATSHSLTIQYFGYEPKGEENDYGLIISDFAKGRKANHLIPTNTSTTTIHNSNQVMVTFFTGAKSNKKSGFVLQYKATSPSSPNSAWVSTSSHLIGSGMYALTIPEKKMYHNSYIPYPEMFSFVFLPKNNLHREGKDSSIVYSYGGETENRRDCQNDFLMVFFFNATAVDKWVFQGRTCKAQELIQSQDMMLILMESEVRHRFGFRFTYATAR